MICVFYSLMAENHQITDLMVDSSIGIANDSVLDGEGLFLGRGREREKISLETSNLTRFLFSTVSRPTLGATQPSTQWETGLFPWG
jgi:hypothetical protein